VHPRARDGDATVAGGLNVNRQQSAIVGPITADACNVISVTGDQPMEPGTGQNLIETVALLVAARAAGGARGTFVLVAIA